MPSKPYSLVHFKGVSFTNEIIQSVCYIIY
ncbi:hypothetical protein PI27_gp129 [Listeria phage WIL-1]|nr:hypothetical protein PI27_gp129 [Listeria phage WIL-1]